QNYPPVVVETGEAPAHAAGVFLGGAGEDLIGAGALTYAIRYRPDRVTNNANSTSNSTANANTGVGTGPVAPGGGVPPPQDPGNVSGRNRLLSGKTIAGKHDGYKGNEFGNGGYHKDYNSPHHPDHDDSGLMGVVGKEW